MANLNNYRKIVGQETIDKIQQKAGRLSKKHILCVNSTYQGGGVAEILNSIVFLFNEIGIDFGWRILHGEPDFFSVTKKIHNALQGKKLTLSEAEKKTYHEANRRFSTFTHINHDLVIIHDPQPLPLIEFYNKKQPWVFRCHVDLLSPNLEVWNYLKNIIKKYDHFIISHPSYKKKLKVPQSIIYPAIDPLSLKNKFISEEVVVKSLSEHGVSIDKPIIAQISRFDRWKDPIGVVKIFELVREKINCQLVLLGSLASDDPEGQTIFQETEELAGKSKYKEDIKLLLIKSDLLVNCLQRASRVIIQKSLREGFGLTVSEALYKGTPVVASEVGGIPLQVIDGKNGFLHKPEDIKGFGQSVIKLLEDDKLREELGKNGKEHIQKNFLITRLILDWLNLFERYLL